MHESKTPIVVRTTTRVPATYSDIHEDWTPESIRECFGDDDSSCLVLALLSALETANTDLAAARAEVERLRKDAEIGEVVWRFIDRMTDVAPPVDSAERILMEFVNAVQPLLDAALAAKEPT